MAIYIVKIVRQGNFLSKQEPLAAISNKRNLAPIPWQRVSLDRFRLKNMAASFFCDDRRTGLKVNFLSSQKLLAAIILQKKSIMQELAANISMRISVVKIVCECLLLLQESRPKTIDKPDNILSMSCSY